MNTKLNLTGTSPFLIKILRKKKDIFLSYNKKTSLSILRKKSYVNSVQYFYHSKTKSCRYSFSIRIHYKK